MFRKKSGLSQRELAELLGCAHGSKVSRYERNERMPAPETLIMYEIIFDACLEELLTARYVELRKKVRKRAQRLARKLDAEPLTPQNKQKVEFLTNIIFPPPHEDSSKN